jgi:hypothetical protein
MRRTIGCGLVLTALLATGCSESGFGGPADDSTITEIPNDPGVAPWTLLPREDVAARCGLDPALLDAADSEIGARLDPERPSGYAIVRHGELCHEYYRTPDLRTEVFSTTKTLGALAVGVVAYQTRDIPRSGPKTGPLQAEDRVDHWLDEFSFNPDALVANVLAMNAHNADLSFGNKRHAYDTFGTVQINRLSDVVNTALAQDPERLGQNIDDFVVRYLFAPLGLEDSDWNSGLPNKVFAFSWHSTVRDMARIGLLMLHDGVWGGERILDAEWVYRMTHPSYEDANTAYGYLTWLNSASNHSYGFGPATAQGPIDACAPRALQRSYPSPLSGAPDCNYEPPYTCEQEFDVGMWNAAGLDGQYIVGHRALDLVIVAKNSDLGPTTLWQAIRPALVALDPVYQGDEDAFCAAYGSNAYSPDWP